VFTHRQTPWVCVTFRLNCKRTSIIIFFCLSKKSIINSMRKQVPASRNDKRGNSSYLVGRWGVLGAGLDRRPPRARPPASPERGSEVSDLDLAGERLRPNLCWAAVGPSAPGLPNAREARRTLRGDLFPLQPCPQTRPRYRERKPESLPHFDKFGIYLQLVVIWPWVLNFVRGSRSLTCSLP